MNFRFSNGNKSKARQKFEFSAKEASPPGADFQIRGLIVFEARHRRKCPNFSGINYEPCIDACLFISATFKCLFNFFDGGFLPCLRCYDVWFSYLAVKLKF